MPFHASLNQRKGTAIPHSSLFNSDVRRPSCESKDILKINLFSQPFNA